MKVYFKIIILKTMAPLELKHINKNVVKKCKALKDLEKGISNKRVAEKYDVPGIQSQHE